MARTALAAALTVLLVLALVSCSLTMGFPESTLGHAQLSMGQPDSVPEQPEARPAEPAAQERPTLGPRAGRELRPSASYEALAWEPQGKGGPWPLLLYLHGAGEMGGELRDILSEGATGTPPVSLSQGKALPILAESFVTVAPHTRRGWRAQEVSKFLDYLLSPESGLRLDANRLYVTGHSMGGSGALAAATTRRFAAAVPVAASGSPQAQALLGVPIWAFHGKNDVIVPSGYTEELIHDLWRQGASKEQVRLTLYEEAPAPIGWPDYFGHASTIPAYATEELYTWILKQSTAGAGKPPRELDGA